MPPAVNPEALHPQIGPWYLRRCARAQKKVRGKGRKGEERGRGGGLDLRLRHFQVTQLLPTAWPLHSASVLSCRVVGGTKQTMMK